MEPADLLERCYPGRRAESKKHILRCALASFTELGIEATTIEVVRAHSQMSVGAIYHHFENKEGLVAALYMAALDDQSRLRDSYLSKAESTEQWVHALVFSYVDWVTSQPDWARFQYQARYAVAKGAFSEELLQANLARNGKLREWFKDPAHCEGMQDLPFELIPSLVIGSAENYCRAWLSGRVKKNPSEYRQQLAKAAWRTIGL